MENQSRMAESTIEILKDWQGFGRYFQKCLTESDFAGSWVQTLSKAFESTAPGTSCRTGIVPLISVMLTGDEIDSRYVEFLDEIGKR
jgi:hypothetical protein